MQERLLGKNLLFNPRRNKGSAFTMAEREKFHLEGLLPSHVSTMEEQLYRIRAAFPSHGTPLEKYVYFLDLQNRNEVLFCRFILENLKEMLPYIYTPSVGDAAMQFHVFYHQAQGVFLSCNRAERIENCLKNSQQEDVDIVVVTDGERVLGLGDVGIGGMVIPIGKGMLYAIIGGIHPRRILPVFLDVGTNNETLLSHSLYLGLRQKRIVGEAYDNFINLFIKALQKIYPNALLHWEDFSKDHAYSLLSKYRQQICSFNDDIQGTAAVVLSGLISACRIKGSSLIEEKIVVFGAGSAGMGIANLIVNYLVFLGFSKEEAYQVIYLIDSQGLIRSGSFGKDLIATFLNDVILEAKITILIGTSAQSNAFRQKSIQIMMKNTDVPIVFPLSNPTSHMEALPEDLLRWSNHQAVVATGSPFPGIPQCNNMYIFPGIGLACSCVKFREISDELWIVAAEALGSSTEKSCLFPSFSSLRQSTYVIAKSIIAYGIERGWVMLDKNEIDDLLAKNIWYPDY